MPLLTQVTVKPWHHSDKKLLLKSELPLTATLS